MILPFFFIDAEDFVSRNLAWQIQIDFPSL